jgi:16S rRNA (cytosine1402-N4)-methyltransferase
MEKGSEKIHKSVLVEETVEVFGLNAPLKKQVHIVDATLGTGGHSLALLQKGAKVTGIDLDSKMIEIAQERFLDEKIPSSKYQLIQGNFCNLEKIIKDHGISEIDGILLDLGVSNLHLKDTQRGFSFGSPEAPLDMRLDESGQGVKASDLLNVLRKDQLMDLFLKIMIYPEAVRLVREIILKREKAPFEKVGDFLVACRVVRSKNSLSQATLPFLALRIAVNSELENLSQVLPQALNVLKKGAKMAVITFHSKEEEVVVSYFRKIEDENLARFLTQKPIMPGTPEIEDNPRARSAKLWVIEKI